MNTSLISVRYAKGLLLLTIQDEITDKVYTDMKMLREQIDSSPELCELLESKVFSATQKKRVLNSIFSKYINTVTLKFIDVVVDNNREILLPAIIRNYIDNVKSLKKIKTVTVITAESIDENFRNKIINVLKDELNSDIELSIKINKTLIGGFILMVDGKMIDASVANKLKLLKKELLS